jgi:hypothetical protein
MPLLTIKRYRRWCGVLACVAAAIACSVAVVGLRAGDVARPSNEYQIKAVFLFNFAQFAEWPARAFPNEKAPFVIGILGHDPFGEYLDELVKDEKVRGRSLVVRRYQDLGGAHDCHILYISRSETGHLAEIISGLQHECVLTISDVDSFARLGGMIRFVMNGGKVRLEINVEAARAAGVTISSKILRPATIVTTGKN